MSGEVINGLVGNIVDVTKAGLGLFTEFPLNLVVIGGLLAMGIGLVRGFIPKKRSRQDLEGIFIPSITLKGEKI